jgi:hypothetical protein
MTEMGDMIVRLHQPIVLAPSFYCLAVLIEWIGSLLFGS